MIALFFGAFIIIIVGAVALGYWRAHGSRFHCAGIYAALGELRGQVQGLKVDELRAAVFGIMRHLKLPRVKVSALGALLRELLKQFKAFDEQRVNDAAAAAQREEEVDASLRNYSKDLQMLQAEVQKGEKEKERKEALLNEYVANYTMLHTQLKMLTNEREADNLQRQKQDAETEAKIQKLKDIQQDLLTQLAAVQKEEEELHQAFASDLAMLKNTFHQWQQQPQHPHQLQHQLQHQHATMVSAAGAPFMSAAAAPPTSTTLSLPSLATIITTATISSSHSDSSSSTSSTTTIDQETTGPSPQITKKQANTQKKANKQTDCPEGSACTGQKVPCPHDPEHQTRNNCPKGSAACLLIIATCPYGRHNTPIDAQDCPKWIKFFKFCKSNEHCPSRHPPIDAEKQRLAGLLSLPTLADDGGDGHEAGGTGGEGGGASVGIGAAEERFKDMTKQEKQQAADKVTDCPKGPGCLEAYNACHFKHTKPSKRCPAEDTTFPCPDTCHFHHEKATGQCPRGPDCQQLKQGKCHYLSHEKTNALSVCPDWKDSALRCPRWETCEFLHPPQDVDNQRKSNNMKAKLAARAVAATKIQAMVRGFLARKHYRTLRATVAVAKAEGKEGKEVDEGRDTGEEKEGEEAKEVKDAKAEHQGD